MSIHTTKLEVLDYVHHSLQEHGKPLCLYAITCAETIHFRIISLVILLVKELRHICTTYLLMRI